MRLKAYNLFKEPTLIFFLVDEPPCFKSPYFTIISEKLLTVKPVEKVALFNERKKFDALGLPRASISSI